MKPMTEVFREEIDTFLEQTGMDATKFGRLATGDTAFVMTVRGGRACNLRTVDKVRKFMAEYPQATAAE